MSSAVSDLIRRSYACYPAKDRPTHESLIAADFHFTSPYDDRIDRARYIERCWPFSEQVESLDLEKLFVDGDEAFVRYQVKPKGAPAFRNVEFIRTRRGQIHEVEVYFGELPERP